MKKHVIFDFDGTLINTNEIIVESWQAVFRHYRGERGDEKVIYASFGETLKDTMRELFPEADVDEAVAIYRNYQAANCEGMIRPFPGLEDLVRKIRETGRTTSIVTSRLLETTNKYLDEFGMRELFDVIVTADDTTAHKPDPEPVLTALRKLGAAPEDSIMLGDTRFDIGCANNAGVDSVLVTWSNGFPAEKMAEMGFAPRFVIDRPEDLLPLL